MIRVTPDTLPDAQAALRRHLAHAMIPLSNLAQYGLDGAAARAPSFWRGQGDDVLCVTKGGGVFPLLPSGDVGAAAEVLRGRALSLMMGEAGQTAALLAACGLSDAPATLNHDEPQFTLDLDRLHIPDGPGRIAPLSAIPRDLARDWRADYIVEALGIPCDRAHATAEAELDSMLDADSHAVLIEGDTPIAMTGFNATLPDIVQVGGVYTPPASRGRGLARRAVALHLAQARDRRAMRATLFASGAAAIRAYRAIGFQEFGQFRLCFFDGPQVAA